jgi:hypothetical protein
MTNKRFLIIIIILVAGNIFFAMNYFFAYKEMQSIETTETKVEFNEKVLDFSSLFIKKVLQADKEVDFETRLSLENAVRDIKDEDIMVGWQNFINSKTESEAQDSCKKLLEILITKIQK